MKIATPQLKKCFTDSYNCTVKYSRDIQVIVSPREICLALRCTRNLQTFKNTNLLSCSFARKI